MIRPIVAYGDPVLKKKAKEITVDYSGLQELLVDMWETMYQARGVGLAAPQIGLSLRIFVIDARPFAEDGETEQEKKQLENFKNVFINPILTEEGEEWSFNEGCLSIPDIREEVSRKDIVHIQYMDEDFQEVTETYDGLCARIIQHEYDHIEGILFTDKLSSLKKRLIKGKLEKISRGEIDCDYRMKFSKNKKNRR